MSGQFPHHRIPVLFALCFLFVNACDYSEDFDALSAYPSNPQRLPIDEIELTTGKRI